MTLISVLPFIAIVFALYMAWNIGANDVANAMGTSVGSKALTLLGAIVVAAIFEFAGATLAGGNVTSTIRGGIISPETFQEGGCATPELFMCGMFAALVSAALWLNIATYFKIPVSTTHSIVGAVFGFGVVIGLDTVNWATLGFIAISWVISPVAGALSAYIIFIVIRRFILANDRPLKAFKRVSPFLLFMFGFVLSLSMLYKGLKHVTTGCGALLNVAIAVGIGAACGLLGWIIIARIKPKDSRHSQYRSVENAFKYLQIMSACYVAFAHGANDVANAIGPFAAIWDVHKKGSVNVEVPVHYWILILGGIGIVIGLATYGYRVMGTIGKKITQMTPSRGFCAEFGTASTVLVCSRFGLPISTTHTLVGAVIGVGFARGLSALNIRVLYSIMGAWLIQLPVTAGMSALIFIILRYFS